MHDRKPYPMPNQVHIESLLGPRCNLPLPVDCGDRRLCDSVRAVGADYGVAKETGDAGVQ